MKTWLSQMTLMIILKFLILSRYPVTNNHKEECCGKIEKLESVYMELRTQVDLILNHLENIPVTTIVNYSAFKIKQIELSQKMDSLDSANDERIKVVDQKLDLQDSANDKRFEIILLRLEY